MKRLGYVLIGVGLLVAALLLVATQGCHGHVIRAPYAPNHVADFDFTDPPCAPAERPDGGDGDVLVRYLGTGGVYLEWNDVGVLTGPFFSNPGLFRAGFGKLRWDHEAIDRGVAGLDLDKVRALLVGHSHYDHLGDIPPLLERMHPDVRIFVNQSGRNMLESCQGADDLVDLAANDEEWVWLEDNDGVRLPVRVMPVISAHAPHTKVYSYATGDVDDVWDCDWERRKLKAMKQGQTWAFVIDLMEDDLRTVAFRVHYQDAASDAPIGFPPDSILEQREVDLAVLCMPSWWKVEGYPQGLLEASRARHALVTHYEDFFRPTDKPLRFVPMLTDKRADRFMERVRQALSTDAQAPAGPDPCPCGPCGAMWTMPLPGEWMRFPTD